MKLLKEIYHQDDLILDGKTIDRTAVRGIILRNKEVFMIYSPKSGDYKFPGGGVEEGETYQQALIREVQEESGALITNIKKEFGKIIEYKIPFEEDFDLFKMTSYYYLCKIEEDYCQQKLDQYEKELGFEAVWVDLCQAIQANKLLINSEEEAPRWTARETFILETLNKANGDFK